MTLNSNSVNVQVFLSFDFHLIISFYFLKNVSMALHRNAPHLHQLPWTLQLSDKIVPALHLPPIPVLIALCFLYLNANGMDHSHRYPFRLLFRSLRLKKALAQLSQIPAFNHNTKKYYPASLPSLSMETRDLRAPLPQL